MNAPPPGAVRHDARLDILCCLDGKRLTIKQVSAAVGRPRARVSHHVRVLEPFGLVKRAGRAKGEQLYEAGLDGQPSWVEDVVRGRKPLGND